MSQQPETYSKDPKSDKNLFPNKYNRCNGYKLFAITNKIETNMTLIVCPLVRCEHRLK